MVRVRGACAGLALILSLTWQGAAAQRIPGQVPNPSSLEGSMELQRRESEAFRRTEQANAQMLERLNEDYNYYAGRSQAAAASGPPPVDWWSKPALPPAKNPLIGRWRQRQAKAITQQDLGPLGALLLDPEGSLSIVNSAFAGGCKSMFGTGVIAFTPTTLSWVRPDGREEVLNNVAYRANGAGVVVVTKDPGAIGALYFGFPARDQAVVAPLNCAMDRVGATLASTTAPPAVTAPPRPSGAANAMLQLRIGLHGPGGLKPYPSAQIWITPEDPDAALSKAGFASGPFGAAPQLAATCRAAGTCVKGLTAMTAHALGTLTTDAAGRAQTPAVPAGRYYLIGVVPFDGKALLWHYGVVLTPGANVLAIDDRNGSIIR